MQPRLRVALLGLTFVLTAVAALALRRPDTAPPPADTLALAPTPTPTVGSLSGPGYPRPLLFRSAIEQLAVRGEPLETAIALAASYDLVIAKALDEELLDRVKVAPYLREISARSPEKIVLAHYGIQSHHPNSTLPTTYPGHWLLLNGTTLTASLSDSATDTVLTVAAAAAIRLDDDLQVTALDAAGQPDYTRVEQMRVTAVNGVRITVERGAYGSPRLAFTANQTRVAAHARVTWGGVTRNWHLNFCRESPRDPQGRRLIEAQAHALASYLLPGGVLAGLDGYQFDVARFAPPAAENIGPRRLDCDADGAPDSGYIRGVNSYGLGFIEFQQTLRQLVGDRVLLLSEATGWWSSRDLAFANGMENESFPDLHHWEQFSSAYLRYQYWLEQARPPRLSYLQLKETTQAFTRCPDQDAGTNWKYRLTLGVALLGDGYFGYMSTNEHGSPQCNYVDRTRNLPIAEPEEFHAGTERRYHYLGAPQGPPQRLEPPPAPSLIANGGFEQDLTGATLQLAGGATATLSRDPTGPGEGAAALRVEITRLAADPDDAHIQLRIGPVRVTPGREHTLRFLVRAEPGYAAADPRFERVPTRVAFSLISGAGTPAEQDVMADRNWRRYALSFVAAPDAGEAYLLVFLGREAGSVWLDALHLQQGAGDVFIRRFEGGLVLVNGSTEPATYDLDTLAPGLTLRRIPGIQDRAVNDGTVARGKVTVPGRDALILLSAPR